MSNGFGFLTPSLWGFIKQVRHLLNDQYPWDGDGLTIVKELVQNANDAGATSLDLGLSLSGLGATAKHPLLNGPALFVINNGRFKPQDAENIARLGTNSKAGDASTVGKFGLGLKSIFHLCETFFYLSSDLPPGVTGGESSGHDRRPRCSVFNPWSPPTGSSDTAGPHEDWDQFSDSDQELIRAAISGLVAPLNEWFALWIPLRQTSSLGGKSPIVPQFFGDAGQVESLFPTGLSTHISEMLPLLHTLKHVRCWKRTLRGELLPANEASVVDGSSRPKRLSDGDRTPRRSQKDVIRGTITAGSVNQTEQKSLRFAGKVNLLVDTELTRLQDDPAWPADSYIDEVTCDEREIKEKALPHCAVRFLELPSSDSKFSTLCVRWAVFLPLGDELEQETVSVPGLGCSVSLHLHGYFFVDAGRNRVKRPPHDGHVNQNTNIRAAWNHRLEEVGTLPLVIPALDAFVQETQLTAAQTGLLTKAINRTTLWTDPVHQKQICCDHQWCFVLEDGTESTTLVGRWVMLPAKAQVIALPPPKRFGLLTHVFPNIRTVLSEQTLKFTLADCPRLSRQDSTSTWPTSVLQLLLKSVPIKAVLEDADASDYLLSFFQAFDEQIRHTPDNLPRQWLREVLSATESSKWLACDDLLKCLAQFVPCEQRVVVDWFDFQSPESTALAKSILMLNLDVVLIPKSVEPDDAECHSTGMLSFNDSVAILDRLGKHNHEIQAGETKNFAQAVAWVFNNSSRDRESILSNCATAKLCYVNDLSTSKGRWVSWRELQKQRQGGFVFADQPGLAFFKELQQAVDGIQIWNLDKNMAEAVLGKEQGIGNCRDKDCAELLAQRDLKLKSKAEDRLPLLKRLLPGLEMPGKGLMSNSQTSYRVALRFLLHGHAEHRHELTSELLLQNSNDDDAVWMTLAEWALKKTSKNWCLLAIDISEWIASDFTERQRETLGIARIGPSEVIKLVSRIGDLSGFPSDQVDEAAYCALLEEIEEAELLKRLPIHATVDGRKVALSQDRAFWESAFQVDSELATQVDLLSAVGGDRLRTQRQRLANEFGPIQAIRLALSTTGPSRHCETILNALEVWGGDLPEDVRAGLLGTSSPMLRWLPAEFGPRSPSEVICLKELDEDVRCLSAECGRLFVSESSITESIRNNRAYGRILAYGLFPGIPESLHRLGILLAKNEKNAIGHLPGDAIPVWIAVDWPETVMPSHGVLKCLYAVPGAEAELEKLLTHLRKPVVQPRLISVLQTISEHHRNCTKREERNAIYEHLFLPYLQHALGQYAYREVMEWQIQLLSKAGTWRSPAELCAPDETIDRDFQIDEKTHNLIKQFRVEDSSDASLGILRVETDVENQGGNTLPERLEETADAIADYFRSWEGRVPSPVIGGFLALLGDDERMRQRAEQYLGKRSLDETRRNVRIGTLISGRTQLQMSQQRAVASINSGQMAEVDNLLGGKFMAPKAATSTTILVGRGGRHVSESKIDGFRVLEIQLRPVNTEHDNLRNCLLNAAETFLAEGFRIEDEDRRLLLERTFEDLAQSDQLEVAVSQRMVLEDAVLVLNQLGLNRDDILGPTLARLTRFRRLLTERQHNEKFFGRSASVLVSEEQDYEDALDELEELLSSNSEAQLRVLSAVRQRIQGHNQYQAPAVPFELFQNADDASEERFQLFPENLSEHFTFELFETDSSLLVRHFGRCVNQMPPKNWTGNVDRPDLTREGFGDDLWKMLTPWLSNKGTAEGQADVTVTGKFGLGFKSVFLVSSSPRILSGDVSCVIVGGIYPCYLDSEGQEPLRQFIPDDNHRRLNTTLIDLPLDSGQSASDILERFRQLAHILAVFGRRIHDIRFCDPDSQQIISHTSWQPNAVPGLTGCQAGRLSPMANHGAEAVPGHALVLQAVCADSPSKVIGSLLLAHDRYRFCDLPGVVPTLWVTAPTQESLKLGFAINALFALDPGRANLARSSAENEQLAIKLGKQFGERLAALFAKYESDGWERFRDDLQLAVDADKYDFWQSLWDLLTSSIAKQADELGQHAAQLVRTILWHPRHGAATRLYQDHRALPNGLPREFQGLVKASESRFSLTGALISPVVLPAVAKWRGFRHDGLSTKNMISESGVRERLRQLAPGLLPSRVDLLDLANLIQREAMIANGETDRVQHNSLFVGLGELLSEDFLNSELLESEKRRVQDCCRDFRFFSEDESVGLQPAADLVIGIKFATGAEEDEQLRAAFAPSRFRLDNNYSDPTKKFFLLCRDKLTAGSERMAHWAVDRTCDSSRRQGILSYLLHGQLSKELGQRLQEQQHETWRCSLVLWEEFKKLTPQEQAVIKWRLGIEQPTLIEVETEPIPPIPPSSPQPEIDPKADLERIYEWWMKNREKQLVIYERNVYPFGIDRGTLVDEEFNQFETRKHWMTLFMLGVCHTMGSFRFTQHRDFIQLCNNKGILDQLADRSIPPGLWHQKVLDYVDSETGTGDTIEYFHWLKQMVGASMISRWLDAYRRTFLATDKNIPFGFGLRDITCPRNSSHFRGAGPAFSAPPLRQVLGMGACFVMRELARREIIQNRQAFRFCFVPHHRTCVLLSGLGCSGLRETKDRGLQSQRIFEFLSEHLGEERATFNGAFDIPFLMLEYFGKSKKFKRHQRLFKRQIDTKDWPKTTTDGDFVTLSNGQRIPRIWMS